MGKTVGKTTNSCQGVVRGSRGKIVRRERKIIIPKFRCNDAKRVCIIRQEHILIHCVRSVVLRLQLETKGTGKTEKIGNASLVIGAAGQGLRVTLLEEKNTLKLHVKIYKYVL